MKHDEHYRRLAAVAVEPIVAMEETICADLPCEYHTIAVRNLSLALAQKHAMRAGVKDGESATKEWQKQANYLHRARTGEWIQ